MKAGDFILSIISINDEKKWDIIVRSFKNYTPFYLSRYAKAFQIHGNGEPLLFYYDNGISTRAINVVMKRDIAESVYFEGLLPPNRMLDITSPYGYGGFLVDGRDFGVINRIYDDYCCEQGFISEFVRFNLFSSYRPHYSGTTVTDSHNVVRSLELSLDEIMKEFAHKVRTNLRKAAASGLCVEIDTAGNRLNDFLEIYNDTMVRRNATSDYFFSKEFFETINTLKNNYVYFHVLKEGQVISTELILYDDDNCYSFLGGTNKGFFNLRPNEFLKYEIIKWAKENRFKQFILGGGYCGDDDLFKYKKYFAPNGLYNFYKGNKIFDNKKYSKLMAIRSCELSSDMMSSFFPAYRAEFGRHIDTKRLELSKL